MSSSEPSPPTSSSASDGRVRAAETVLRRLGFSRARSVRGDSAARAAFWVEPPGDRGPRPVYLVSGDSADESTPKERWLPGIRSVRARRGIWVVPTDRVAEAVSAELRAQARPGDDEPPSILVVPPEPPAGESPHWYLASVSRSELLRLATGVVVGLFRRAQRDGGGNAVDFGEMLELLRRKFGVDPAASLGVDDDESALFLLYQLALRDTWAPGDGGANLHLLVLKPTGPAARLPWFAA